MVRAIIFAVCFLFAQAHMAFAQHACRFYAQNPDTISVTDAQDIEREVEIDFTNTGTSTWQNTGGVSNLQYIELRPVGGNSLPIDGPLYHSSWINRQRVGSFLAIQQGVAPQQVARFVFKVRINGQALGIGTHDCYFRPYHAQGGYIHDWGNTRIRVIVTSATSPPPGQVPTATIQSINPANPAANAPVQFTGMASNNPIEYRWEANGQLFGASASVQQSFAAGTYNIRFLARNQYGWSQAATATMSVQAAPQPNPPGPTTMTAHIQSAVVERTVLNAGTGTGSFMQRYDLVASGSIPLRRYHVLQMQGAAGGGTATAHEWSLVQGSLSKVIGNTAALTTQPDDLFVGRQEIRYRVRDANGNWSSYASLPIDVAAWPQLFLPVHGTMWRRSGNDYNEGDHRGNHSQWAQDWNGIHGGNTDFGYELVASLPGTISTGEYSDGGRYVNIEHTDAITGQRFRVQYMHLSSMLVRDGQSVVRGQPIGLCGNTGSSSQATHLHYVLSQWINGAWVSVAPEPFFLDDQTVRQTIAYNETVNSGNRVVPSTLLILPEQVVTAVNRDDFGYGGTKHWGLTTNVMQPTSYASWDCLIPESGTWKLWMHNPSGVTNNNGGISTHNTTTAAQFEISRPRVLGLQMFSVNQAAGIKGGLVEVCSMDLQAGDRLLIRQHNATGESGREISYDELILTLEVPAGSGGNGNSGGGSNGSGNGGNNPNNNTGGNPVPPTNPPTSPQPVAGPGQPGGIGGGGSGGGGCSMSRQANGSPWAWAPVLLLFLITLVPWRRLQFPL